MPTRRRRPTANAFLGVMFEPAQGRWRWTIVSGSETLADSDTLYPSEHDARAASREMFRRLVRGEGDQPWAR